MGFKIPYVPVKEEIFNDNDNKEREPKITKGCPKRILHRKRD